MSSSAFCVRDGIEGCWSEKSLADIRAFSERENRDYEETRRLVAKEHIAYLFRPQQPERQELVGSILMDMSTALETLNAVAGTEAFLLAVDPADSTAESFLGGSLIAREFWRGLRHGGDAGAKSFRQYCLKAQSTPPQPSDSSTQQARQVKSQLYDLVRQSLRTVSGVRHAEMKWTNHSRLSLYGVALIGWPEHIPTQNPSTLKTSLNKQLLQLLKDGTMYFVRIASAPEQPTMTASNQESESSESLSWAIHDDDEDDDESSTRSDSPDARPRKRTRAEPESDGGIT